MADEQTPQTEEVAGAAEGEEAAAAAAGAAKKKKMMLIGSVVLALVGIAVAVGVVFLMGGKSEKSKEKETPAASVETMAIYDVPEMNVNLLSEDPTSQHFLKIKLAVQLENPKDSANVDKLLPHLQDDWIGFLRQMRMGDMQGSANLQRLKEGLLRRANQSLDPVPVKGVYIRELLVQ
jgi:flagellar FliL protein